MGRLQNEDHKSSAELIAAGGTAAQLLNDSKIYVTGNGINDTLYNAIVGGSIGGGGGGSKNYITVGSTFENNATTGWSLAHSTLDSTSKVPNQVSGSWTSAAGTLSITTVGSGSQLAGNYSLSLVSSAATTAGDMLVSNAITLDKEAQASVQTITCYYKVASGSPNFSGTSSNSLAAAIYDVTNSVWIQPSGTYNFTNTGTVGKFSATFQVPSNSTSVRLALFFPNASSGAVTIYFDDFGLGPQVSPLAPAVSDFQSYTPTFAGMGTVTGIYCYWARFGNAIRVYGKFTTGTVTAANATFTLPNGLTNSDTQGEIGGEWWRDVSGGGAVKRGSLPYAPGSNLVGFSWDDSTQAVSPAAQQLASSIMGSSQTIFFWFQCPITGWSSNSVASSDTDTRIVAMQAYLSTNTANAGANTVTPFNTVLNDTHAGYSTGTNLYTVPVSGYYRVSVSGITTSSSGTWYIRKNSTSFQDLASVFSTQVSSGAQTILCNAGDTLGVFANASLTFSGSGAPYATCLSIERLSGPAVITATESVNAAYYGTGSLAVTTSYQNVTFNNREYDSHLAFNGTTFTAPVSGVYLFSPTIAIGASAANNAYVVYVKNGTQVASTSNVCVRFTAAYSDTRTYAYQPKLNAGDTVSIQFAADTNGVVTVGQSTSRMQITRVGN
jgi:hypothetical protein